MSRALRYIINTCVRSSVVLPLIIRVLLPLTDREATVQLPYDGTEVAEGRGCTGATTGISFHFRGGGRVRGVAYVLHGLPVPVYGVQAALYSAYAILLWCNLSAV